MEQHMKISFKKVISSLFIACTILGALAGCSGSGKDSSSGGSAAASAGSNSSGAIKVPSKDVAADSKYADPDWDPYASMPESIKGSTVRFATWLDHTQSEGALALSTINDDIGIKVELFMVPQSNYIQNLQAKIASGDIPDVCLSNENDQSFPLTMQILQPINKCSTIDLNEPFWDQGMIARSTFNGDIYMLNSIGSPWVGADFVYYNKNLFEENGIKTPQQYYDEGEWTLDNLKKVLKDVKSIGSNYQGGMMTPQMITAIYDTAFIKYDYKTGIFSNNVNDPNLVKAYQWYADVRDEGLLGGSYQKFMQGLTGIVITDSFGLRKEGYFKEMSADDIGYVYLPTVDIGGKQMFSSNYRMYGIVAGAKNPDAGAYFIRYWLDNENYDLTQLCITADATQFYLDIGNHPADEKFYSFDEAGSVSIGSRNDTAFTSPVTGAPAAQVKTKIQSVSNLVDTAVKNLNEIVSKSTAAYN